jgi:hypothetical protein
MTVHPDGIAVCHRCKAAIRELPGTSLVCRSCVQTSASQTFFVTILLVIIVATIQLLVSGCDAYDGMNINPPAKAVAPSIVPVLLPHRPYINADIGIDRSGSDYPSVFFNQANQAIADSIDNVVQPNGGKWRYSQTVAAVPGGKPCPACAGTPTGQGHDRPVAPYPSTR